jgi:hypothetical protein
MNDTRINHMYRDTDGWWIELVPGFVVSDEGTHGIVEDSKRAALAKMAMVVPCNCNECRQLQQRGKAKR